MCLHVLGNSVLPTFRVYKALSGAAMVLDFALVMQAVVFCLLYRMWIDLSSLALSTGQRTFAWHWQHFLQAGGMRRVCNLQHSYFGAHRLPGLD